MRAAMILEADTGLCKVVKPENGTNFSLKEMQDAVGGFIERVVIEPLGLEMFVNEEGKLQQLPINIIATRLSGLLPHDFICGNAIIGQPIVFRDPDEALEQGLED